MQHSNLVLRRCLSSLKSPPSSACFHQRRINSTSKICKKVYWVLSLFLYNLHQNNCMYKVQQCLRSSCFSLPLHQCILLKILPRRVSVRWAMSKAEPAATQQNVCSKQNKTNTIVPQVSKVPIRVTFAVGLRSFCFSLPLHQCILLKIIQ